MTFLSASFSRLWSLDWIAHFVLARCAVKHKKMKPRPQVDVLVVCQTQEVAGCKLSGFISFSLGCQEEKTLSSH